MKPSDVPFQKLCEFYDACAKHKKPPQKHKHLRQFRKAYIDPHRDQAYDIYRLILPALDKEREHYGLKETALARALNKACGLDPKINSAASQVENWRTSKSGMAQGHFADVAAEYLFRNNCGRQAGTQAENELTIGELNSQLDRLARSDAAGAGQGAAADAANRAKAGDVRIGILRHLLRITTPRQMRWIVQLILRELKASHTQLLSKEIIGMSEATVLRDYHVDAEDRYNVTCDFQSVIRELTDPNKRFPFQDIALGKPAKAQLAKSVRGPEDAYQLMKGRQFVVETKFDGERHQVHVHQDKVEYWSRRAVEHAAYSSYDILDAVIFSQLRERDVVLDGEIIVWNRNKKIFEPFGGLKPAVNAAKTNKTGDELLEMNGFNGDVMTGDPDYETPHVRDLELVFVAWDVLYLRNQSVINRSLLDRQALLKEIIMDPPKEGFPISSAMTGRVVTLLPGKPLMSGVPGSKLSSSLEDIQDKFEESIRVNEEGIIIKDALSQWKCNDRGNSWLKIKPEYVNHLDIDAVIIGAKYGTGRRGGGLAEYLLALAETPRGGAIQPSFFVSFCVVGTGVNDHERHALSEKILANSMPNKRGRDDAPSCYRVTGLPKERPDVWVKDPFSSIVLQVQADVRTIRSRNFASRHSLRFPRVHRVRWDKAPTDIQTDAELWAIVEKNKGAIVGRNMSDASPGGRRTKRGAARGRTAQRGQEDERRGRVVEHFAPTDVSGVTRESTALAGCLIFFVQTTRRDPGVKTKAELEALVARLGGKVAQNWMPRVTHVVAQDTDSNFFRARLNRQDMLSLEWLLECAAARRLVPPRPHHYLHLTKDSKKSIPDICKYGDMHYEDVTASDVGAILSNHARMEDIDVPELAATLAGHAGGEDTAPEGSLTPPPSSARAHATPLSPDNTDAAMDGIMAAVDRELLAMGLGDPSACLFRRCHVCLVPQPGSDLAALHASRISHQVWLHGGRVDSTVKTGTTHVVLVPRGAEEWEPDAAQLLELLWKERGGVPALSTLRRSLLAGSVHVVHSSWVEACLDALQSAERGTHVERPSEEQHAVLPGSAGPNTADSLGWPWEAYGVSTKSASGATPGSGGGGSRKRRARSPAGGAASAEAAGGTAAAKRGQRARNGGAARQKRPPPLAPPPGSRRGAGRGRGGAKISKAATPEEDIDASTSGTEAKGEHAAQGGEHTSEGPRRTRRRRPGQQFVPEEDDEAAEDEEGIGEESNKLHRERTQPAAAFPTAPAPADAGPASASLPGLQGAVAGSEEGNPSLLQSLLSLPMYGGPRQDTDQDEQAPPSTHAVRTEEHVGSVRGTQTHASGSGADDMGERVGIADTAAPEQSVAAPAVPCAGDRPRMSLRERMKLQGFV